ncbi:YheC/YheD family protein [Pontibacillus sp. HMF3514]|uniref:YheC/YheD family endospore coat-associated protein n=1 Tax=Pontibacillus sp. HMF3514 TaxID=2692425 RepID=UPI00132029B4|nr:YheC/YheD family protein [Pontibacillus sp. HMF3514]QHE51323.1 hypothetical protein GS400_04430 [Pontibacillus sp. HMF3514]
MESYHFQIQRYPSHRQRIIVPKHLYKGFHQKMTLTYCTQEAEAEIMTHQKDVDTLYISHDLMNILRLPEDETLSCFVDSGCILFQPLLGVYTAGFQDDDIHPIGDRTPVFESMTITGQSYGFDTLFFGYQHIDWEDQSITGYVFHNGEWMMKRFPFPYVIYDRIPNRKVEHHPFVLEARERLEHSSIMFNTGFFNKWKIYDQLRKTNDVSHYLPSTVLHPTKERFQELLYHHRSLFIKPIHGSKGAGIKKCRVQEERSEIECIYYDEDKEIHQRYQDLNKFFHQQFPNGFYGYIAQPEVRLKSLRSTPMDYRVHTNKNERNEWEVTAICMKFAGKGSLTTHVKRGGSIHTLDEMYDDRESQLIYQKLERVALLISKALEKQVSGPLGEIGFDFGIDEEGKVWLFEANSKPGFAIYDHPTFLKEQSMILSYPFRYAKYFYVNTLYEKNLSRV